MLTDLTDWVIDVIRELSYLGVAFLVVLENLFPPIPSEVVLPFAGVVAADGDANLLLMVAVATVASVVGAWILYGIAAAVGPDRIHTFLVRYGKWFRLTNDDVAKTESFFDRHAAKAVLIGRCVPLIRSLISVPAGFRRMNFATFTLYTAIGSLVWNLVLIWAGYLLRDRWHVVEDVLGVVQYVVIAAILGFVAWFVWSRFLSPQARAAADPNAPVAAADGDREV